MRIRVVAVLAPLAASLLATRSGVVSSVDTLRAEYYRTRAPLVTQYPDFARASGTPGFGLALDRAWVAVANWAAAFLDEHPDATAEQLAKAVDGLDPVRRFAKTDKRSFSDYQLSASAVRLTGPAETTFAVAANYTWSGTFFVIARANNGHFRAVWNIKDIAHRHYLSRDEIGYWAASNMRRGWALA
jgi:hypothetical protein